MKKKLLFFGIDSATWDLIKPWAASGKLPGFAKLLKQGTALDLTSTIPPITPVAWPTAMTGATPAQHGFYDFYKLDENKEITVNLASELPYPFFWEQLSKANLRTGIFNVPITYPFRAVNGIMISGLMTPGTKADFIEPKSLRAEFLKKFPKFRFGPEVKVSAEDPESYKLKLKENIEDAKETIKISRWLLEKEAWDFVALNFMAVDHVQHFFWEFMDNKKSVYQNAILEVYQIVDKFLLEIMEKHSRQYQIMVFSDHGAGPLEKTLFLNRWLLQKGYLKFKSTPGVHFKRLLAEMGIDPQSIIKLGSKLKLVRRVGKVDMQTRNRLMNKLVLSYADLDWDKTSAYSFGMYGGIYLTKKNKALQKKIMAEFEEDFKQEITFLATSEEIYKTKFYPKTIPDIQFLLKDGAIVSTNIYAFAGRKLMTPPITNKSGEHRLTGILGFYPKLKIEEKKAHLTDITPTILDFYGLPIPEYCHGQSLLPKNTAKLDLLDIEI